MKRFSMNIKISIFSLLLYLTTLACKTNRTSDSERIKTVWTYHRAFGKANDTLYLEVNKSSEKTDFVYYESHKDSFGIMLYSILKNEDLVFFKTDTFKLSESSIILFENDSLCLLKYEYPDPLPGGMGCMVFAEEIGLLGMGLYVGEKRLLTEWNQMNVEEELIMKKMKRKRTELPPPPNYEK